MVAVETVSPVVPRPLPAIAVLSPSSVLLPGNNAHIVT